jgi:hypothetical protein
VILFNSLKVFGVCVDGSRDWLESASFDIVKETQRLAERPR